MMLLHKWIKCKKIKSKSNQRSNSKLPDVKPNFPIINQSAPVGTGGASNPQLATALKFV